MSRIKLRKKKHLCYYGFARVPWYRLYCPVCQQIVSNNLPALICCSVLLLLITVFALYILFKS